MAALGCTIRAALLCHLLLLCSRALSSEATTARQAELAWRRLNGPATPDYEREIFYAVGQQNSKNCSSWDQNVVSDPFLCSLAANKMDLEFVGEHRSDRPPGCHVTLNIEVGNSAVFFNFDTAGNTSSWSQPLCWYQSTANGDSDFTTNAPSSTPGPSQDQGDAWAEMTGMIRRSGHSMVGLESVGQLIFFGGEDENGTLHNDVWHSSGNGDLSRVWHDEFQSLSLAARHHHSAVWSTLSNSLLQPGMLVYGGRDQSGSPLRDLWYFGQGVEPPMPLAESPFGNGVTRPLWTLRSIACTSSGAQSITFGSIPCRTTDGARLLPTPRRRPSASFIPPTGIVERPRECGSLEVPARAQSSATCGISRSWHQLLNRG